MVMWNRCLFAQVTLIKAKTNLLWINIWLIKSVDSKHWLWQCYLQGSQVLCCWCKIHANIYGVFSHFPHILCIKTGVPAFNDHSYFLHLLLIMGRNLWNISQIKILLESPVIVGVRKCICSAIVKWVVIW